MAACHMTTLLLMSACQCLVVTHASREASTTIYVGNIELGDIPVLSLCYDINALLSHGIKKKSHTGISYHDNYRDIVPRD